MYHCIKKSTLLLESSYPLWSQLLCNQHLSTLFITSYKQKIQKCLDNQSLRGCGVITTLCYWGCVKPELKFEPSIWLGPQHTNSFHKAMHLFLSDKKKTICTIATATLLSLGGSNTSYGAGSCILSKELYLAWF